MYIYIFFGSMGFELRASSLARQVLYCLLFFGWVFFKVGSHELFAQAGFEL
jgi:hypothetical protein